MYMNQKVLRVLEFDKIISALTDKATSEPGKMLCSQLLPVSDLSEIEQAQLETADAFSRLVKNGRINFSGNREVGFAVKSLELGATLSITELLHIASLLECTSRIKTFARGERGEDVVDSLQPLFGIFLYSLLLLFLLHKIVLFHVLFFR